MPHGKRWHFKVQPANKAIVIIRDGSELVDNAKAPAGAVRDIIFGAASAQARNFKEHALEVSCFLFVFLQLYVWLIIICRLGVLCMSVEKQSNNRKIRIAIKYKR